MFYYTPSVERAYNSILDITYVVTFGGFIRNMHRWAAHGMVLVVLLHMSRVFYTGSYMKGRSLNWIIGIALLLVTMLLSFSGYLLPWDQLAFWAVTIGANIAGSATELTDIFGITSYFDIGRFIKKILLGGPVVGQDTLIRFYLLHIILLPLICAVLIAVHFWRIRKDGGLSRPNHADDIVTQGQSIIDIDTQTEENASPSSRQSSAFMYSWPTALWGELAAFTITLAVLSVVSLYIDAPLKDIANPAVPENPAKSPWYFLGLQELVSYSAFSGGIGIPLLLTLALILIPYLDREDQYTGVWFSGKEGLRTTIISMIYASIVTLLLLFTVSQFGWIKPGGSSFSQFLIMIINPGALLAFLYSLWSLIILYRTESTRLAAMAVFTCTVVGFCLLTILGLWFRGPDWEFYWLPSQWPAH
jgi:quinol-cytochrome oxidoreductase complex cytochrome b subunit